MSAQRWNIHFAAPRWFAHISIKYRRKIRGGPARRFTDPEKQYGECQ
jgi:hypothetical protein